MNEAARNNCSAPGTSLTLDKIKNIKQTLYYLFLNKADHYSLMVKFIHTILALDMIKNVIWPLYYLFLNRARHYSLKVQFLYKKAHCLHSIPLQQWVVWTYTTFIMYYNRLIKPLSGIWLFTVTCIHLLVFLHWSIKWNTCWRWWLNEPKHIYDTVNAWCVHTTHWSDWIKKNSHTQHDVKI
jgi:hypothetical protein